MAHLEVVLILSFDKLVYLDVFLDTVFIEGGLENLVVLNILIIEFGTPFDFVEIEGTWVNSVHDLGIN